MGDPNHTLAGVLTRLRAGGHDHDPELAAKLDRAFSKHHALLERVCRRALAGFPAEIVEETVQDVLFEAWRKLPEYRPDRPFHVWLWSIAELKCRGVRRKRRDVLSEDGVLDAESGEPSVLTRLADEQRDRLVDEAAQNVLDAKDQEVVHLRWVLDHSYEEVAEIAGLDSANEVRTALQRCRRRLEKEIVRLLEERGETL